jgi:hypothetical protein
MRIPAIFQTLLVGAEPDCPDQDGHRRQTVQSPFLPIRPTPTAVLRARSSPASLRRPATAASPLAGAAYFRIFRHPMCAAPANRRRVSGHDRNLYRPAWLHQAGLRFAGGHLSVGPATAGKLPPDGPLKSNKLQKKEPSLVQRSQQRCDPEGSLSPMA